MQVHFHTRNILFSYAALPRCISQSPRGNWSRHWEWTTPWSYGPSLPSISWSTCYGVVQVCHFWCLHDPPILKMQCRWNPPLPVGMLLSFYIPWKCWFCFFTGIPHASTENDQYLGCHIPKGAIVMANLWSVTILFSPIVFAPTHLRNTPQGTDQEPWNIRWAWMFSSRALHRRQATWSKAIDIWLWTSVSVSNFLTSHVVLNICASICPGRAFADMNIWLAVASITACFKISSNGAIGDPKFTSGLVS